jgi:hypothetical protein
VVLTAVVLEMYETDGAVMNERKLTQAERALNAEAPRLALVIHHVDGETEELLAEIDDTPASAATIARCLEIPGGVLMRFPKPADDGSGKKSVVIDSNDVAFFGGGREGGGRKQLAQIATRLKRYSTRKRNKWARAFRGESDSAMAESALAGVDGVHHRYMTAVRALNADPVLWWCRHAVTALKEQGVSVRRACKIVAAASRAIREDTTVAAIEQDYYRNRPSPSSPSSPPSSTP